uniref:Uncharacterized protein n=1 Tax=Hanusia phi TaxID=3032 RepID=A0A7S0EPN1_9CRYP|mmetsp:Transcript_2779/g.6639  ORF Transcript_2779/g.6639 Transcript_2779/m.6639 type:complete len:742 (+) Transcript_2779:506-2731(+)
MCFLVLHEFGGNTDAIEKSNKLMQNVLQEQLNRSWILETRLKRPLEALSEINPIDKIVSSKGKYTESKVFCCLVEACSGSGKSLCAVDFHLRHPQRSLYFLFRPPEGEAVQPLYKHAKDASKLLNVALDFDFLMLQIDGLASTNSKNLQYVEAWSIDMSNISMQWHFLGAISFLCGQARSMAPLTFEEAGKLKGPLYVLVDEAIPSESDKLYSLSSMARLVLMRRILRNARINCIMLGTNTLVMNFNQASTQAESSRFQNDALYCVTHRALPPFIPSSNKHLELLSRLFGAAKNDSERNAQLLSRLFGAAEGFRKNDLLAQDPRRKKHEEELLDEVNPWLLSLFFERLALLEATLGQSVNERKRAEILIRESVASILPEVRRDKLNLRDESIYCMFQIATHESLSQIQISKGFAQLNVWKDPPPARGSDNTIIEFTRDLQSSHLSLNGLPVHSLTSRFSSAVKDPITVAVCAGNGSPFQCPRSALTVLQHIHSKQLAGDDPITMDAYKRDGNVLESFGAVVVMLSSWSKPQDLLKTFAFHCGMTEARTLNQILEQVEGKESFIDILTSSISNLVPVRRGEITSLHAGFGFYCRCSDSDCVDGAFGGPSSLTGAGDLILGGAEFKNHKKAIVFPANTKKNISKLLQKDLDVFLYMASYIPEFDMTEAIDNHLDDDWLVLRLRATGWEVRVKQGHHVPDRKKRKFDHDKKTKGAMTSESVKRRVLMVVELGDQTQPFCGAGRC